VALPTVVGVGAAIAGIGAVTPAYPAGYTAVADDCAFTFVECESTDTVTPPTNWAVAASANVATGTPTKLTCLWRRLTAGEAAPTIADAGNHMNAQMIVIGGVSTAGNPWDIAVGNTELVADTTVSIPGGTTTGADRLIMAAFSTGQDVASTAGATGWADGTLANVTERMDNWATAGLGGGFAMATGEKATAGTVGPMTATLSLTANFKALLYIALRSQPPGQAVPEILIRSPRPAEHGNVVGPYAQPYNSSQFF
jgi:hypothetical protein